MQSSRIILSRLANRVAGLILELAFQTKKLREWCEDLEAATAELGGQTAHVLAQRIAELRSAASPDDLIVGSPRKLVDSGQEIIALKLTGKKQIRFCANHTKPRVLENGRVDWSRVRRVRVVAIGEP